MAALSFDAEQGETLPAFFAVSHLPASRAYIAVREGGICMPLYQTGIDVSRYQGSINWNQVASAGKQFAIVRVGSSNANGVYVDPYFLQNVNGAKAAGLRVGAYYYTYARTTAAVNNELSTFMNAMSGIQFEYPIYVDVEDSSLTSLGRTQLTNLVRYAMDVLAQNKWYAGWYSYTNFINNYLNASVLNSNPLWVADYRSTLGYTGPYSMWQYSGSGQVNGINGACDLNYSYFDFLPDIRAGGFNNYGSNSPEMMDVEVYQLVVFGTNCEYFYSANVNDIVGYLPLGTYPVVQVSQRIYEGRIWVTFRYNGGVYWTVLLSDRNRLEVVSSGDCSAVQTELNQANAKIDAAVDILQS